MQGAASQRSYFNNQTLPSKAKKITNQPKKSPVFYVVPDLNSFYSYPESQTSWKLVAKTVVRLFVRSFYYSSVTKKLHLIKKPISKIISMFVEKLLKKLLSHRWQSLLY